MPDATAPIQVRFSDVIEKEGPLEFIQGSGVVCKRDGGYETHFHGSMSDQWGVVSGGHLIKGATLLLLLTLCWQRYKGFNIFENGMMKQVMFNFIH